MEYNVGVANTCDYELDTVKRSLEEIFNLLGFANENPLGHIIKPGMRVFIKPNWVASRWRESCAHKGELYSVITHPTIIEAVADFVELALKGSGEIIIGDNPSIDADFEELMQHTGIRKLENKYSVPCSILDMRGLVCEDLKDYGHKDRMKEQRGDPRGSTEVNLGKRSLFHHVNSRLFRGVFTDRKETKQAHTGANQLYTFSNSMYEADVYISIPKLKTHHKAGVTLNLKGLVGTVTKKNQLVHWRVGFPLIGGDEYQDFKAFVKGCLAKVKSRGSWAGNDTIWRMVVDLYHAFTSKKKAYFTIIDGIMAGDGDGPFCPREKRGNILIASEHLIAADIVATRLMGFEPMMVPHLRYFIEQGECTKEQIQVRTNVYENQDFFSCSERYLAFVPPHDWDCLLVKGGGK